MGSFYTDTWKEMPCLEWTGARISSGYGWVHGAYAHVMTYEECFGPIPKGLKVLHKCDNPPCRQPLHLWTGTDADNMRDASEKGRMGNQRKTHCPYGHEYTEENTYRYRGYRYCRACQPRYGREVRQRKKERKQL